MKQIILMLSLLFSVQCFGQKWHLNSVDKSEKYPYEYWFRFENLEDTCSYQLTNKSWNHNSVIKLFDNQGNKVDFADIKVINFENNSEIILLPVLNGKSELHLDNGHYRIEGRLSFYDDFNLEFEIKIASRFN